MDEDNQLLTAIAAAGGIDPIDVLRHLIAVTSPEHFLDMDGGLLPMVLEYLRSEMDASDARIVKEILWDARLVTLAARDVSSDEKSNRLAVLDQIGHALFPVVSREVCRVEAKAVDFTEALQMLEVAQGAGSIRISYRDGQLELSRSQTSVRIPVEGKWPFAARVDGKFATELLCRQAALPSTFVVSASDTRLHFGDYSIRCRWETE
jgi:hypothetical protein